MATINPTITRDVGRGDGSLMRVVWTPVTAADVCAPIMSGDFADKSVQALGTFDSANVAVHGSNDGGTTYAALNDPSGTVIDITVAGIKQVLENTEWLKPVITTGGGSQSMSVALFCRLANPLRT